LNTKGFDFAKGQLDGLFKEMGMGDSSKSMEKLLNGNEELKKLIRDLLSRGTLSGSVG
jgi:hypothetical protein